MLTFWESEEEADAGARGKPKLLREQVEKFVTLYSAPPGRETYQVVLAEEPAVVG